MKFVRPASFFAIAATVSLIAPAQAQSIEKTQPSAELHSHTAVPTTPLIIRKKITTKSPQKGGPANAEMQDSKTAPQPMRLVEEEIQRIKPMPPKKYETYGKNIHLIEYEQQVRNAQIKYRSR